MRPAGGFPGSRRLTRFVVTATTLETMARVTITAASNLSFLVANKGLSLHQDKQHTSLRSWKRSNPSCSRKRDLKKKYQKCVTLEMVVVDLL